ncbi:MAG: DUF4465 domain-containing protein [Bacteroidales bacterium]|jgi:hypothetical protein|nr:DUF4465 domain-containing protein [Bacteroidales bacterium]
MKTKNFLIGMAFAALVGSAFAGCGNSGGARSVNSAGDDPLTLDLKDSICGVSWKTDVYQPWYDDAAGYWEGTYMDIDSLCFGEFVFDHFGATYGSTGYWGGFTFGRNGSTTNYGYHAPDSTGSVDWIPHQWGVMAGGGIKTVAGDSVEVQKGLPYLVAFGSSIDVWLKDNVPFLPVGVFICNHPWPYWGNLYGDGFARPLNQEGDYFKLLVYGVDANNNTILLKEHPLAEYDTDTLYQSRKWEWVSLQDIVDTIQVKALRFRLETTDVGEFGPNTAFYFCMDRLQVVKGGAAVAATTVARKATVRKAEELLPEKQEFGDFLTMGTHKGGAAVIYGKDGKVVLKTTLKSGSNKVDTRKLPAGEYLLIHHHRTRQLIKK